MSEIISLANFGTNIISAFYPPQFENMVLG